MPSTDRGMPIPLDSDPLSDVAKWTRDLAASLPAAARRGTTTATTDASGDLTITHALGATPTAVLATINGNVGSNWTVHAHTFTSTTFKLRFRIANTAAVVASTAGVAAGWIALA